MVCDGETIERVGHGLRCRNAKRLLLLTRIVDLENFGKSRIQEIQQRLSRLPADYDRLLEGHVRLHRPAMGRMTIALDQSDDRYLSSEELVAKQSDATAIVPAFLEKMFNMGRYALLSSSGPTQGPVEAVPPLPCG